MSKRVAVLLAAAVMAVTMLAAAGIAWAQEAGTLPADPSDLTATAASSSQIDLSWKDNATDEDAYVVERSPDGSTDWTQLGSALPADSTTYSDQGLSGATTYHYRVKSANVVGDSGYSNTASATTKFPPPGPSPTVNPTPDDTWMTNGIVYSMVRHGDYVYVGGKFTRVRQSPTGKSFAATNLARFRADTGVGDPTWTPDVTGADMTKVIVYEVAAADGKIWVGGRFGAVDGVVRRNLAAVSPDTGAVDPTVDPVVGTETSIVHTMLVSNTYSKVYLGGAFGTVDGKGRKNIAALDFSGNVDLAWKPKVDKPAVRSLAFGCDQTTHKISEATMFATGQFRGAVGSNGGTFEPRENIAQFYTESGTLHPWAVPAGSVGADEPGLDLAVSCTEGLERVTVPFSGPNVLRSFRLDNGNTGTLAWQIKNGGEAQTAAMLGPNKLIIGGHFSQIEDLQGGKGVRRERLAQLNLSDGSVDPWNPGASGKDGGAAIGPWDLLVDDNRLYVGGGFYQVGGSVHTFFARFTFTP